MWKTAKSILGWSGPPTHLYHMGRYVTSPVGLATMNTFFMEKVKKLRGSIPVTDSDPLAKMRENMRNRTSNFSIQPVTEKKVIDIISNLRGSKATGLDFIDV